MADLVEQKTADLLKSAQEAHHTYEKENLEGKRDEQWATWYAEFLVTNGFGGLIGKDIDEDELAALLDQS
ncbi:MAG TPA: hypothetical protein VLK33_16285, partial [Terriglobales bacterium]|nr:hypothetical protein [Terriglobales bacterium]